MEYMYQIKIRMLLSEKGSFDMLVLKTPIKNVTEKNYVFFDSSRINKDNVYKINADSTNNIDFGYISFYVNVLHEEELEKYKMELINNMKEVYNSIEIKLNRMKALLKTGPSIECRDAAI